MCGRSVSTYFESSISTMRPLRRKRFSMSVPFSYYHLQTVYKLFSRFHMWVDRLLCAVIMKKEQYVIDTLSSPSLLMCRFKECDEELAKKQLCEVIAKLRLSHLFPYDNTTVRSLAFSHLVRFSPCFGLSLRLVRRSGEAVGRGAAASPLHRPFPSTRRQQRTSPRPLSRRWRTRRSRQRSRSSTVF